MISQTEKRGTQDGWRMDSQTIRTALGKLQVDPDSQDDWDQLRQQVKAPAGDLGTDELLRLLDAAREQHQTRGEWDAVRNLLEIAAAVADGTPREVEFLRAHARVLIEELLDDDGAAADYVRLLEINPDDASASEALEETERKRERHRELVKSYVTEADAAQDDVYKSSMLMRASEMELRFAGEEADIDRVIDRLEQAVRFDPSNVGASKMLERVYRRAKRWDEVARVLERVADRSEDPASKAASGVRLARVYLHKLKDADRASRAYDRVLRARPDQREAMEFLSDFYSKAERWDELVQLYENDLKTKGADTKETAGDIFQIAMLHWKKRESSADAEPWFERIRKVDPTHEGVLNFFRQYLADLDDDSRLIDILSHAQKATKEKDKKAEFGTEIAKLAEGQKNAQKAIEQYKSILRQDPDNADAREALKRLYKQTQGYNALVELLRQQLERTPVEAYEERVNILREVATVYRQYLKSDTALVSVLNQIVQLDDKLDERDIVEIRELVNLYEKLGRFRDLLTNQQKLAEWTKDLDEKKSLYRAIARRWLEQFSNVQNATEAYAELFKLAPDDGEARERLEELYRKRRAWPALYELYESELATTEGAARLALMKEMAVLAAERLNRGSDAVTLYQRILDVDPSRTDVLDALEKHAERAKDWPNLADALERRVEQLTDDTQARLGVLQKLGSVYAEHIGAADKATQAWRRVLELQPGHPRALRVLRESFLQESDYDGLEELYGSQSDWEGLADVFSTATDRARDDAQKVALSYRAAAVYEAKLNQADRAFRSYERILAVDPEDARAAAALIPLYEKDEKWSRLPALYEVLLDKAETNDEKVELLGKLVQVSGSKLADKKAAALYAQQAYAIAPGSETALDLLEDSCRAAGAWDQLVESLEARLASAVLPSTPPPAKRRRRGRKKSGEVASEPPSVIGITPAERRMLALKLARVYSDELGKSDEAIATLKKVLDKTPADADAAQALEAILRREQRKDDLRWLLELRVEHAENDDARLTILREWASLEEEAFEDPDAAITLHRRVLELDPADVSSLSTLARLLLSAGDPAGAVKVIEQHREVAQGDDRANRDLELAELYLTRLEKPSKALEAAVRALDSDAAKAKAVTILERLVERDETKAKAAELLAELYASGGDARREAQALEVMIADADDDAERLELYQRLATVLESKLGAHSSALDVVLQAVVRYPNEISLWDRAEALSSESGRPTELAERFREVLRGKLERPMEIELSERAARLHEDKLGDPIGAAPYLEKILELDPSNESAFQHLKDILTAAERWGELESLYDRASKATNDIDRQVDMLIEVALICEEITEDAPKAIRYYERILAIEPAHEASIKALDRLYVREGDNEKLAELLKRRLESAVDDELFELKLRLARIQIELHHPESAIDHVEDVLRERQNDYQARELAERMLEIGSLRVRAARMLEGVYEVRNEIRDLVRVLVIRLEGLDEASGEGGSVAEQCDLLRRIATLRDDRLHDDAGALEALCRLVPLDPLDADARERLIEVGRRVGEFERVAVVLTRAAKNATSAELKGEILLKVASIYEAQLADRGRAELTYREVLELDETDANLVLPAARALEQIYIAASEHQKLAEILRVQVKLEPDPEVRATLWGRLGELCQNVLGDTQGAIVAWKARVDESPEDDTALAALDSLYGSTGEYAALVAILDRRREIAVEPERRKELLTRAAQTQWKKLELIPQAIDSYQALVDEFGPDVTSLSALEELYASAERWEELGDVFQKHLDIAPNDGERLRLYVAMGQVKRKHLADWEGALGAYRLALELDRSHAPSREALEEMLDSSDPITRRESAAVLRPIYEAESDAPRLLRVLEIEIETADDPDTKLRGLERAMSVAEDSLEDRAKAYSYAERAVREAAGHTAIMPYLEHLERLAAATQRRAEQVKLMCEVVPQIFDGVVQIDVTLRIADLARHQLADRELAREYYQKALELRVDDPKALAALESLYEEAGDAKNLLEVLERRADTAETDADRKQLLFRRGRLLAEVVEDRPKAIEVYEAILDMGLDADAIEALEGLYTSEASWPELIALHQRQLDAGVGDPALLHVKIAQVAAKRMQDLHRAFDEFEAALEIEKQHEPAIKGLEELLSESKEVEFRARAASLLEPVYLIRADYVRLLEAIKARLEFSQDPSDRRELLTRLAKLYEEQQEDYLAALDTTARLLDDDLADEATVGELERLAKVAGANAKLAEIYSARLGTQPIEDEASLRLARRLGELYTELGKPDQALLYYRKALEFEPQNRKLFDAVDAILLDTKQHAARVELYRESLENRFEAADRLEALHVVARLQTNELAEPDHAIETYREALEVDESNLPALDALTQLYRQRKRWNDLAEHYLRRAETASVADVSAGFRLDLAKLYKNELEEPERALDQLEEIVRVLPAHPAAIAELEAMRDEDDFRERTVEILRPLYESLDDWKRLIKLNEDRFQLARDVHERVAVLRETAELWETRGRSPERARLALKEAFRLDPEDTDVRASYERLTEATSAWDELATLYDEVLLAQPDIVTKRDVLATLAEVHNTRRDDPRRALDAYERLHRVDEMELAPLNYMERLATLLSDWQILVRVLTAKADLTHDDEERASIWRRVGESKRDMLDDPAGAIDAYEKALEIEPGNAFTADCLIELYEQHENADRLVELYQQRVELCDEDDGELKYNLLTSAAEVFETKIDDRLRAIESLNQALETVPGDAKVLASLNRLYRAEAMWPELLDNLRVQADQVQVPDERAALRRQIGEILATKLENYDDALEAYRLVLEDTPVDEDTIGKVRQIGEDHEELRSIVAQVLVPVLTRTEANEPLVGILEMRLTAEMDPSDRVLTLRSIAEVLEQKLQRTDDAEGALLRALAEKPEAEELHEGIERLAQLSNGWGRYVDVLEERAGALFDPEVARDLLVRAGRIAEQRLADNRRAVENYTKAVEQAGDHPELLAALDRLYTNLGDPEKLAEILDRRVAVEDGDDEQAELFYRLGKLQISEFKDSGQALQSFRSALERKREHDGAAVQLEALTNERDLFEEASDILEEVYRARGQTDKLAALYEKRIGFAETDDERIDMRRSLARVLEEDCGDPRSAQRVLQQGLSDNPADSALLEEIERLAPINSDWESACAALGVAIEGAKELPPEVASQLCIRLAGWHKDQLGSKAGAERALVRALDFEPENDEILALVEQLQSEPGREEDLLSTLRRRAKLQLDTDRREEVFRRAKELADKLGGDKSEQVLRELLEQDDVNVWGLSALTELAEAKEDFGETFDLLVRRAELPAAPGEVKALKHRAASIARDKLKKNDKAIELFDSLFEDDPDDREAAAALRALYSDGARYDDLSRLLERLVDLAESPAERSTLRLELATLNEERFQAVNTAVDLLRAVLDEEPGHSQAVVRLSVLYEKEQRDEELADLLSDQISAARDRGDTAAELTFQVRLGEVYDARLGDRDRAIDAYKSVLERDARHRGALEALARLYQAAGSAREATEVLEQLLDMAAPEGALDLVQALVKQYKTLGDSEKAARALERGLNFKETEPWIHQELRGLYRASESWEQLAKLAAREAELEVDIDKKVALLREAAQIQGTRGGDRLAEAELLRKASELKPDDRDLLLQLCDSYSASGRAKEAIDALQRIVESYGARRSKELADIHKRLATAYLAEGQTQQALDELDKAFRIEPGNVAVLKQLGEVALDVGDMKKAQQMFRALLLQRLDAGSPITKAEVFMRLGQVHGKLGEKSKAIQMLERAIQADASLTQAKTLLDELKA